MNKEMDDDEVIYCVNCDRPVALEDAHESGICYPCLVRMSPFYIWLQVDPTVPIRDQEATWWTEPVAEGDGVVDVLYVRAFAGGDEDETETTQTGRHTPGPWRVSEDGYIHAGELDDPNILAIGYGRYEEDLPNWEENARLMAAAPQMLAALKRLLRTNLTNTEQYRMAQDFAREAIATATGEVQ